MKKLLIIILLTGFSIHSQTPTSIMKGYYLQKIGDSIVGQNTRPDKAFFDLYNYMVKRKIKKGTITSPYWEIDIDYPPDLPPQIIRDTIYFSSGHISIGNSWMGEPIGKTVVLRINAGGETFTDWVKMEAGNSYRYRSTSNIIKGETIKDMHDELFKELFKTEAYNTNSKLLSYAIPLPNGYYEVDFFMVSQYSNTILPGTRVFSILLEGKTKDTIDINERFGTLTAGMVSFGVDVIDGVLNISFENVKENALVNAIQIRK